MVYYSLQIKDVWMSVRDVSRISVGPYCFNDTMKQDQTTFAFANNLILDRIWVKLIGFGNTL